MFYSAIILIFIAALVCRVIIKLPFMLLAFVESRFDWLESHGKAIFVISACVVLLIFN